MPRSLLAAFRSADGRSIARALALLVLVSALVGGVATGYAAGASADWHCTTNPDGTLPSGHDGLNCCPGMIGGAPALPPPAAPSFEFPNPAREPTLIVPRRVWIPEPSVDPGDRPRGPPLSA